MKGIININKPQEFTSHDCVAILRRLVGVKRVGHTGTLDPMATGVLPLCVGTATRIIEYLDNDRKEYRCTMELGIHTNTCDIWGEVLERKDADHLTEEEIRAAFDLFIGKISQVPPIYSALKIKGKKLYEYARAGQEVEIKPREIMIYSLDVEEIKGRQVTFCVTCGKGTYLRSICRDVGSVLGVGGTMTGLVRLASGAFRIEDSVEMEDLRQMSREEIAEKMVTMDYPLTSFSKCKVDRKTATDFIHGRRISPGGIFAEKPEGKVRIYYEGVFLGMAEFTEKPGELKPDKVFQTEI